MSYRILLLMKAHIKEYCQNALGETFGGLDLFYEEYKTLEELISIFQKKKREFDGFITSGLVPGRTIERYVGEGEEIPVECFNINVENIYSLLLKHKLLKKDLEFGRIGIDFLSQDYTLEEALIGELLPKMEEEFTGRFTSCLPEKIEERESELLAEYRDKLDKGELDLILTHFYSVVELGRAYGVDSCYAYPSPNELKRTFDSIKKQIDLKKLREKLPGAILILPEEKDGWEENEQERELYLLELKRAMMALNKKYLNSLILKESYHGCEIYTNSMQIREMTDGYRCCRVREILRQEINFNGTISYGIGTTLNQARLNALEAGAYGKKVLKKTHGSFLMDEKEKLYQLSGSPVQSTSVPAEESRHLKTVASGARLSVETISKLAAMIKQNGSDEVTSAQIVKSLEISPRTASKILNNLLQNGYARLIGQEHLGGKGRPSKHYRLDIGGDDGRNEGGAK